MKFPKPSAGTKSKPYSPKSKMKMGDRGMAGSGKIMGKSKGKY